VITPFNNNQLGPNSYDLELHEHYVVYRSLGLGRIIDSTKEAPPHMEITSKLIILHSKQTMIVMTKEVVTVKQPWVGILSPRSGFARLPITISYSTLVDTGYSGVLGCQITNHAGYDLIFRAGQRFMQIMFIRMEGVLQITYQERKSSKYLHNDGSHVPIYKVDKEWLK